MKEATGNALVMTMMASIIAIIMIFFVWSISYSKSYILKNYIINQIEENGSWNDELSKQLDAYLLQFNQIKQKADDLVKEINEEF